MIGYPLDSHVTYDTDGTPQFDRAITSEPLRMLYKTLFNEGVLPGSSTNMQVVVDSGMNVSVLPGFALCNGCQKLTTTAETLTLEPGNAAMPRIDTIVLRLDDNSNVRSCEFAVKQGTPSASPIRPTLTRAGSVYEIGLADIRVNANMTQLSNSFISDTRYEDARCGVLSSISEFPTDTMYLQVQADLKEFRDVYEATMTIWTTDQKAAFDAWFAGIRETLDDNIAGHLQNEIDALNEKVDNIKLVHINISYDPSLAGATITVFNDQEVYNVTADASGSATVDGMSLGIWTITEDAYGTSTEVNTTFYGNYSAAIGGDRFINVEYASAFEGKVITCSDGVHTQTRIATGGRVQFVFANDGLFTISAEAEGQTYSTGVRVKGAGTYNASLQTTFTCNITIRSAVGDTIYYYDGGSPVTVCTTDSSGSGTGTITTLPDTNITLYSTIAKDTTDESLPYSKEITIDSTAKSVDLFPVGTLYWYGLELVNFGFYPWDSRYATTSCVSQKNTNNIFTQSHGNTSVGYHSISAVSDLVDVSTFNKLKVSTVVSGEVNLHWGLYASISTNLRTANTSYTTNYKTDETGNFSGIREIDITNAMGDMHCAIGSYGGVKTVTTSRMWLE